MALLNQSQYLPNQLLMGAACLVVFALILALSFQYPVLWKGHSRTGAWLFFTVASGVGLFKLVSVIPFLSEYNLEPLAHMVEEVGCIGAYAYLAWYQSTRFANVTRRPGLAAFLGNAWRLLLVCWVAAILLAVGAALGFLPRFDMTGMHMQLPGWSVLYRSMFLVPGFLLCSLFTWLFIERAMEERLDTRWAIRLILFAGGTFTWVCLTAAGMFWAVIGAFGSLEVWAQWATPQIAVELSLFIFMGLFWGLGLAIPYRSNSADQTKQEFRRLQQLSSKFADLLPQGSQRVCMWHTTLNDLRQATSHLELPPLVELKIQRAISATVLLHRGDEHLRDEAATLLLLRQKLLNNLPGDSPERHELIQNPNYEALGAALRFTENPSQEQSLSDQEPWLQVAADLSERALHGASNDSKWRLSATVVDALRSGR